MPCNHTPIRIRSIFVYACQFECITVNNRVLATHMPKIDGIEVLQRIRKTDPSVNVIIMTGYGNTDLAVKAMKMGAEDFVTKPFEVNDVQKVIFGIGYQY